MNQVKNITPLKRLRNLLNNFSDLVKDVSDQKELGKRTNTKSSYFGEVKKEIHTDVLRLFRFHKNKSFGIHFYFYDENNRVIPKEEQSIEFSLLTEDEELYSLKYTVEEFRVTLSEINKEIANVELQERFERSEAIVSILMEKLSLETAINEATFDLTSQVEESCELEFSNLEISRQEEKKLTLEIQEAETKLYTFSRTCTEYNEVEKAREAVREAQSRLREAENKHALARGRKSKELRLDERKKNLTDTQNMKDILISKISSKARVINQTLRMPNDRFNHILNKILGVKEYS